MQAYRFGQAPQNPKSLLEAAAYGNVKAVQQFLAKGAKVDQRDARGWTALHHAVGYGELGGGYCSPTGREPNLDVVKVLLKAGVPLNTLNRDRMTALMCASSSAHGAAARLLVDAGADLRPTDAVGGSALTMALWYERYGMRAFANYLIQKGSPINLWDALWLGDTPRALALAATVDVSAKGPKDFTYLHLAALLGNAGVVGRLLARKASVKARADKGWTPLHVAMGGSPSFGQLGVTWHRYGAPTGREGIVSALLAAGANPNQKDSDERTPLEWAVAYQAPSLMRLVLKAGGNPNQKLRKK